MSFLNKLENIFKNKRDDEIDECKLDVWNEIIFIVQTSVAGGQVRRRIKLLKLNRPEHEDIINLALIMSLVSNLD